MMHPRLKGTGKGPGWMSLGGTGAASGPEEIRAAGWLLEMVFKCAPLMNIVAMAVAI